MDPISFSAAAAISGGMFGAFFKTNPGFPITCCFSTTGAAVSLNQAISVAVGGALLRYASGISVTLPTLTAGTDYAIYACTDGTLQASANFSSPPTGYTTSSSQKIGGFHFAPGSNAAARAGGNSTPTINPYSLWDLKFRPSCPDPRGMALVSGLFWCDIYLTNTAPDINGTSKNNASIACGTRLPIIPAMWGGNGSTAYSEFNWWDASEIATSAGKRLLSEYEFAAAAYGTTEGTSRGTDAVTTGISTTNVGTVADNAFTSKWGVMQATGAYWIWGRELGGPYSAASYTTSPGSRGAYYELPDAAVLGGFWNNGGNSGSRASYWIIAPTNSASSIGARACCDHLILV